MVIADKIKKKKKNSNPDFLSRQVSFSSTNSYALASFEH